MEKGLQKVPLGRLRGGSYIPLGPFLFSSFLRQKGGDAHDELYLRKRLGFCLLQKDGQKKNDKIQNIPDY